MGLGLQTMILGPLQSHLPSSLTNRATFKIIRPPFFCQNRFCALPVRLVRRRLGFVLAVVVLTDKHTQTFTLVLFSHTDQSFSVFLASLNLSFDHFSSLSELKPSFGVFFQCCDCKCCVYAYSFQTCISSSVLSFPDELSKLDCSASLLGYQVFEMAV